MNRHRREASVSIEFLPCHHLDVNLAATQLDVVNDVLEAEDITLDREVIRCIVIPWQYVCYLPMQAEKYLLDSLSFLV